MLSLLEASQECMYQEGTNSSIPHQYGQFASLIDKSRNDVFETLLSQSLVASTKPEICDLVRELLRKKSQLLVTDLTLLALVTSLVDSSLSNGRLNAARHTLKARLIGICNTQQHADATLSKYQPCRHESVSTLYDVFQESPNWRISDVPARHVSIRDAFLKILRLLLSEPVAHDASVIRQIRGMNLDHLNQFLQEMGSKCPALRTTLSDHLRTSAWDGFLAVPEIITCLNATIRPQSASSIASSPLQ